MAQGLSTQGLAYAWALTMLALGGLFWLLMKQHQESKAELAAQRDRYEQLQKDNKTELVELLTRQIANAEKNSAALESIQSAIQKLQRVRVSPTREEPAA